MTATNMCSNFGGKWDSSPLLLKEYISKCDICLAHPASPGKESLFQHEFVGHPWSKIGADLSVARAYTTGGV